MTLQDRNNFIKYMQSYAESPPTFTYGMDEFLNARGILIWDVYLNENFSPSAIEQLNGYSELIKTKRIRFIKSQLTSPNIKPHQVNAFIKALELEEDNVVKPTTKLEVEFV